jgi:hypothetical protein
MKEGLFIIGSELRENVDDLLLDPIREFIPFQDISLQLPNP